MSAARRLVIPHLCVDKGRKECRIRKVAHPIKRILLNVPLLLFCMAVCLAEKGGQKRRLSQCTEQDVANHFEKIELLKQYASTFVTNGIDGKMVICAQHLLFSCSPWTSILRKTSTSPTNSIVNV